MTTVSPEPPTHNTDAGVSCVESQSRHTLLTRLRAFSLVTLAMRARMFVRALVYLVMVCWPLWAMRWPRPTTPITEAFRAGIRRTYPDALRVESVGQLRR